MTKVISFQNAAAVKQEAKELDAMKSHILGLISEMTQAEIVEMHDAIERNDQEKYFAITNPVIARRVIREINTKRDVSKR